MFNVGDEVWYMSSYGAHKDKYHCLILAVYEQERMLSVSFTATGVEQAYPQGHNHGTFKFTYDTFQLKTPVVLSPEEQVKQKIQYLWTKSKWGKTHPLGRTV